MSTRHVAYIFDFGLGAYDKNTESKGISEVETQHEYTQKLDINIEKRELIDDPDTGVSIAAGQLILITEDGEEIAI